MPEFGGFWRDIWGIFGGHLEEFGRKLAGNVEGVKRRLQGKNLVFLNLMFYVLMFTGVFLKQGGMPEFGGFWRDIWGIVGGNLEDVWMNFGGNLKEMWRKLTGD